jgi:amino acid permease
MPGAAAAAFLLLFLATGILVLCYMECKITKSARQIRQKEEEKQSNRNKNTKKRCNFGR